MRLTLITAPTGEPVTLADVKNHARIDVNDDDAALTNMIRTARQKLDGRDGFLGRALMLQTWELVLDRFPSREIRIPLGPLSEVVSVKYIDRDGVEQTVAAENYETDKIDENGWIVPVRGTSWPLTMHMINAVRVRFIAGYGGADDVPEPIRHAIRMHVAHLYENRELSFDGTMRDVPMGWYEHVEPYRMQVV
jgi:uncharacterized phiE125 gp8 family phage protein